MRWAQTWHCVVLATLAWIACARSQDMKRPVNCERDPNAFGPPWPAEGTSIPDRGGRPSTLRLTPSEGEDIRCALLAHTSTTAARATVDEPFRSSPATWRVGGPWLSADGPRIGEYWLQRGETNEDIVLMRPLGGAPASRYSLGVTMSRHGGTWRVATFGGVIDHAAPER
jgi:hypothetical protein